MSNDIEIVVRDRDETGPGAASAKKRMERLGAETERTLGDSGKKAGKKFADGIKAEAERGARESSKSIVDSVATIDEQIEKTKKQVADLGQHFIKAGDADALAKLRDARGVLSNLEKIKKEIAAVGTEGGEGLADNLDRETKKAGSRAMSTLKMAAKPAAIGAGVVLGLAVAQGMGQALAAGGAVGVAGLGAAILSQRKDVKLAGAQLVEDLKQEFMRNAEPLVEPLLKGVGRIKDTLIGLGPSFKGLFADSAPAIDALVSGLTGFIRGVMPGLREFIKESGPGLRAMADGFTQLGRDVGTALKIMSDGSKDGGEALQDLIEFAGDLVIAFAAVIRGAETFGKAVPTGLGLIMKGVDKLTGKLTKDVVESTSAAADHQKSFARTLHKSAMEMKGLTDAAMEYNQAALALTDSDIALQQAIDDATESIKNNGKTLDINTQKGRDNKSALLAIAGAALEGAQSVKELGGSQASATKRLNDGYTAFTRAARGAGMTKSAADKLARSYGLLPRVKETKVKAPGATKSKRDVDSLRNSISRLHGKDVFITTHHIVKSGSRDQRALATGGLVGAWHGPSAQTGGVRSNRVLVGEHMPEIAELPTGTRVNSGPDSQRMMADRGGDMPPLEVKFISSGSRLEDLLMEILRKHVDVRWGGNIDAAFRRR